MDKSVNEHLLVNIRCMKKAQAPRYTGSHLPYKRCNKRYNFLMRIHKRYGRSRVLSSGEVKRCKLNPTLT